MTGWMSVQANHLRWWRSLDGPAHPLPVTNLLSDRKGLVSSPSRSTEVPQCPIQLLQPCGITPEKLGGQSHGGGLQGTEASRGFPNHQGVSKEPEGLLVCGTVSWVLGHTHIHTSPPLFCPPHPQCFSSRPWCSQRATCV